MHTARCPKLERAADPQSHLSKSVRPGVNNPPWVIHLHKGRTGDSHWSSFTASCPSSPNPALPCPPHLHPPVHFGSITLNVSCHTLWRNTECGHSMPGNSVGVQFNSCISFHFFIALHQGRGPHLVSGQGASSQNPFTHFLFLYNELGLMIDIFSPSL